MSAREWQPGDKALIEVEVTNVVRGSVEVEVPTRPAPTFAYLRSDLLRPVGDALDASVSTRPGDAQRVAPAGGEVEAATEDVVERAARAIADYELGDYAEDERTPSDWTIWLGTARALAAAGLLAGGVPGRSDAEIKAEALEGAAGDIKQRIVTFRELKADPQYLEALNDAWGLVMNRARAARVAGTTDTEGSK